MKKKFLSAAFLLALCLAFLPGRASALSNDTFEYTLSGSEVYITKLLDKNVEELVIPSTIDGKPVTQLGSASGGSLASRSLKSVTIPGTVKKINYGTFLGAANLTSVTFSEGLEEIGPSAFLDTGVKDIVLPESVKTIGAQAFQDSDLTSIRLPSTLKSIPGSMVQKCKSLTSISLPASVREIGTHAFAESGLTSLTVPAGVTLIPGWMCSNCESLAEVSLPAGVTQIDWYAFQNCTALKSILLPTSMNKIDSYAFSYSGLEQIIIPYGVTKVGGAFEHCDNLTAIYAPSGVEELVFVPKNAVVYCAPGSRLETYCKEKKISFQTDASVDTHINVIYNGKRISFGAYGQNPTIINSRTMVPLRSIFEAMGADVQWDAAARTVTATRGATKAVMTVGQSRYTVNGSEKTMDTPPTILNGRTMVPVRVVAESFGANVSWNAAAQTAVITA